MYTELQTLVIGKLKPENTLLSITDETLVLPHSIETRIEEIWEEKVIESKERGKPIFNGTSYRLINWSFKNNLLEITLGTFDYKHRLGLSTMGQRGELHNTSIVQGGCFVNSTTITSDGYFCMVKLSGKSMNNNIYDFIGGMAETDTPFNHHTYLFDALYKEMEEEACIDKDMIESCTLRCFFQAKNGHYGFHFLTKLSKSKTDIEKRFKDNTDIDIDSLVFLKKDQYLRKLSQLPGHKPLIGEIISKII